ncbi:AAA family ATPase [Candidatus Gracilibacteria bacterium]|nr:AAA family ATPase [Candidatus Gracilibacteria bacterium]
MTIEDSVFPEIIKKFVKPEIHTSMFPVDATEGVRLFSHILIEGVPDIFITDTRGSPIDRVSSFKAAEDYLVKYVKGLIKEGYISELFDYMFGFKAELDISTIENIKLNSQGFSLLSADSQRKVVLYKVLKKLEKNYKPIFIEYNKSLLTEEEDNFKKDKLKNQKNDEQVHFLDKDIFDSDEKILNEKDRLKKQFLIESINSIIAFFLQYGAEIKKNYSLSSLTKFGIESSLINKFVTLFISGDNYSFNAVVEFLSTITSKDRNRFISIMNIAGVTKQQIDSLISRKEVDVNDLNPQTVDIKGSLGFDTKPKETEISGFLPFASDFGLSSFVGTSAFLSFAQASGLYKGKFNSMLTNFTEKLKLSSPNSYGLNKYHLSTLQLLSERIGLFKGEFDKDNNSVIQCNVGFEVSENFSEKDLIVLANFLSEQFGEFNLDVKEVLLGKGYVGTNLGSEEDLKCKGIFKNNAGFDDDNLLLLESKLNKSKKLFINISDFSLDNYLFASLQVAYYIKHKSFIDPKKLFANIYHSYNLDYIDGAEVFNVESQEPQYREFIKHVVAPNSIQYAGKIKPSHTVLMGTQGTGKSQFILNLSKNRNFEVNNTKFDLNSVVIPIDLMQLKELIKDSSYIKNRIREVQENTGLSVIIVVEDICTLIEENEGNGDANIVSQALTTLFEGMGSLANVTIVSTTNYPERLPPRLTRKGRFQCIIPFFPIEDLDKSKEYLAIHIKRKGLESVLKEDFIEKYAKKFLSTTQSHIANFIEEIEREIDFKKALGEEGILTDSDIEKIFANLNFSIDSIKNRQKAMEKWLDNLRAKNKSQEIGFIKKQKN